MKFIKKNIEFYFNDLDTAFGRFVDFIIVSLIVLSAFLFVADTYDLSPLTKSLVWSLDTAIGVLFILEYLLRLWVAKNKIKHFLNIYSLIDLIAILPSILLLETMQFIRIFRILRVFRFTRFLQDRHFFFGDLTEEMLIALRISFTVFSILFVSAGFIYHAENAVNPEMETFFDASYYTIVTLATVGFGDIIPMTQYGKLVTMLMILSGMIFIPWQIAEGIRFFAYATRKNKIVCQHCGLEYHDRDASNCKHCGTVIFQQTRGFF